MNRQIGQPSQALHLVVAIAAPGLLAAGTALDALAAGRDGALTWLAFWSIVAGVGLGAWCAAWALLDWIFFSGLGGAGVLGLEGLSTATVVGLYGFAALLRIDSPAHSAPPPAVAFEVSAATLLGMKAWLGSELAAWLAR